MGKVIEGYLNPDESHEGDWVSSEQPRTAAGRALPDVHDLARVLRHAYSGTSPDRWIRVARTALSYIEAEAAAAAPLDVERLAEAMAVNGISDGDWLPLFDIAEKVASEYESTSEGKGRTPCPVCPHWLELHNPDGSCGCGMNCRTRLASADEEGGT